MSDTADVATMWVACITCHRPTSHDVVREYHFLQGDEDDLLYYRGYNIIRCRGCHTVSFAEAYGMNDDRDQLGEPIRTVTLYPSRTAGRKPIEAASYFPPKVQRMYLETLQALNVEAPVLATVGMRALTEAICLDRGCVNGTLADKINELVTKGELAQKQADFLNVHRFLGNDAAHEMLPPPADEVIVALDILENLLRTIYELPTMAAGLTASREQRRQDRERGISSTSVTFAGVPQEIRDSLSGS